MKTYRHFKVCGCTVVPETNSVIGLDGAVTLEPKTMDCLVYFLLHSNEIITKDSLVDEVWDGISISDEAVTRVIHLIRKSFKDIGVDDEVIRTHRKRGYQLVQPVKMEYTEGIGGSGVSFYAVSVGVLILGMLVLGLWKLFISFDHSSDEIDASEIKQIVEVIIDENLEENQNVTFTLLTNQIIDTINRQATLVAVVNRLGQAERRLANYDFRLNFSSPEISGQGASKYLVSLKRNDSLVWKSVYPMVKDVKQAAFQHRLIISEFLKRIDQNVTQVVSCSWPENIEALEQYFLGKKLLSQRGVANLELSISHFKNAISLEAGFAQAWSEISYAYTLIPAYVKLFEVPKAQTQSHYLEKAREAANKALAICPNEVKAIYVNGDVPPGFRQNQFLSNEYRIKKALEIEPNNAELLRIYFEHLWRLGRFSLAMEFLSRARLIEPWNARIQRDYADVLISLRDYEQAADVLTRADQLGFKTTAYNLLMWFRIYLYQNEYEKARSYVREYHFKHQDIFLNVITLFEENKQSPASKEWQSLSRKLRLNYENDKGYTYLIHKLAMIIGDYELAMESWLEVDKVQAHGFTLWWPESNELTQYAEFQRWVNDVGMIQYWKTIAPPENCRILKQELIC